MMLRNALLSGSLAASIVRAAQPEAAKPVAAPMRDLVWGQVNFLHTTDTHAWLSGHLQEPQYSADWGDYISFSEHIRKQADDKGADLLIIDTGDRIEGTGLYDSSTPKGLYQYDIYAEQGVDIVSTGNHELYKAYSVDCEHNTTVPNFKGNYLASNLDYIDDKTGERVPQAQRYRKFKTKNLGLEIVAFGFLFDFTGNANNSVVQPVAETIKEEWFQKAIREKPDLFVVTGHVGLRMEEFKTIFTAIRRQNWHIPIVFFGGHFHVRDALRYDDRSFAIASGRYLETIGWMSIDGIKPKKAEGQKGLSTDTSLSFSRKYIDNNLYGMYYHTGLNETTFPTKRGQKTSQMITKARKALNLNHVYGCAPRDLWMSKAKYPGPDSVYTWIEEEVLPDIVTKEDRKGKPRLAIVNTGGIRFDVVKGPFTRDSTYTVSPFSSGWNYIPDVPYKVAREVIEILNSASKILDVHNVETKFLNDPQQRFHIDRLLAAKAKEEEEEVRLELRDLKAPHTDAKRRSSDSKLLAGYTTVDDIGNDGDDTVRKPLEFYATPNCIQAEIGFPENGTPDTVDLVFLDFVQPFLILALRFSGGDFDNKDVKLYMEGTLADKLVEWVSNNWKGEC